MKNQLPVIERFMAWLVDFLYRNGITLLLISLMLSVMFHSLDEANWVREDKSLPGMFTVSILFGYLLARSHFPGWFVAVYAATLSAAIAVEGVARTLPSIWDLFSTPFFEIIDQMTLRGFQFYLRATGWIETLEAGENVQDTGLFVILLVFILSLCGIWLIWSMVRKRSLLIGLLPLGFLFAINVQLSRQSSWNYLAFLFCAVLLTARISFNRLHEDWSRRRVDFPEQLGLEWSGVSLILSIMILLAAWIAPLFSTSEGLSALSDWMSRTREQTSVTAERLFSGVNRPPPPAAEEPEIYVNTPDLGEIGGIIPQGFETVMYVTTSDPAPIPAEIGMSGPAAPVNLHYWRSAIFSEYTGRGWEAVDQLDETTQQPEDLPEQPPQGRYFLRQGFEIDANHAGTLFAASEPVQVSQGVSLRGSQPDGSQLLEGQTSSYVVISAAAKVTANQLSEADTDYPQAIREAYLQLPDTLPGRVRSLAQRIAANEGDPYQKALRIQNYLRETYPYDFFVEPAPQNRDVADYFLFDAARGFCSHYATAMVVMLRSVDVPARVVTGYAMGDYDPQRGAFRVPVSASHAWVEVYFSGYGWVEFEPTAYRTPFEYPDERPAFSQTQPAVSLAQPDDGLTSTTLIGLVAAGGLLLLMLPFLVLRLFAASRQAPAVQVNMLYSRMRRALAWAGLSAVSSVTPDEYLVLYAPQLARYSFLSQALRQVTDLYRQAIFSPREPDQVRVRIASQLWRRSLHDWLLLWLRAFWKRMSKVEN